MQLRIRAMTSNKKSVALAAAVVAFTCFGLRVFAEPDAEPKAAFDVTCRLVSPDNTTDRDPKTQVECDYRHESSFEPTQLTLEVSGAKVKLERDNIKKYPAEGQTTAIFVMFDLSDPRRNTTTTELYPKIVNALSENRPDHIVLGIGTFAQSLDVVSPFQALKSMPSLEAMPFLATGVATELNRVALTALKNLGEENADRKLLLVVSDGKAEDTAYSLVDVSTEAKKLRIPIATIGIAERPSETPALQSLRLLAEQSGGVFFDFSDKEIPSNFRSRLLTPVEVGGRVSFEGSAFHGKRLISVTLGDAEKRTISSSTELDFPDLRDWQEKLKDFATTYWWLFVGGVVVLVGATWGAMRYSRIRRERQLQNRVIAEFRGLDGGETRYEVRKSAVTIGRGAQNDIVISNSSVSGRHAELHQTREGKFRLSDLGSTNGTFVNEARITAVDLEDGDLVEIAEVHLQFKLID